MPYMTRIPSDLARFGLRVELVPGWETRGSSAFAPACVVDHWTAGPRATAGRPSLNVVTNGRPGLPGPLCNVYLARNGACVVVAAGRANHAGTGGFRGLVGNSAAYGIEAESGGDGDWTPEMLAAYPRLNAALLWGLGRDASWLCDHHTWTPRKIDIRDIIGSVRAQTAAILANPGAPAQEDDDMDANQAGQLQRVHDLLGSYLGPSIARQEERQLQFRNEALAEIAGLRSALAAVSGGTGLSPEQLLEIVEKGAANALRENVVTVDVDINGASSEIAGIRRVLSGLPAAAVPSA